MTNLNSGWRGGTPPAVGQSAGSTSWWTLTGRVTAETSDHGNARAGGTGALLAVAGVVSLVAVFATGAVGALLHGVVATLFGFFLVPVLFFLVFALLFPRAGGAAASLTHALRPRMPRGRARTASANSHSVHLLVDPSQTGPVRGWPARHGHAEDVLIAARRRVPVGTEVRVWGPRLNGCRHAWVVQRTNMRGLVVARGVVPAVAALAFAVMVVATVATGGGR